MTERRLINFNILTLLTPSFVSNKQGVATVSSLASEAIRVRLEKARALARKSSTMMLPEMRLITEVSVSLTPVQSTTKAALVTAVAIAIPDTFKALIAGECNSMDERCIETLLFNVSLTKNLRPITSESVGDSVCFQNDELVRESECTIEEPCSK